MSKLWILFHVRPIPPRLPIRKRLRIIRRFPRIAAWSMLPPMVTFCTRCPISHASIAHNGLLVDQGPSGRVRWAVLAYARCHRGLAWMYRVETPLPVDLTAWPVLARNMRVLPSLISWLSLGRIPATNCVSLACSVLRGGGVDVPRSVVTPAHLFDWLRAEGYPLESLV